MIAVSWIETRKKFLQDSVDFSYSSVTPVGVRRTKAAGAWGRQRKESLNCLPYAGMTAQKGNLLDLASGTCFTLQLRKYKSKLVVNYNFRIIHQLMCNTREISLPRLQFICTLSMYHS